jgi:glycosyltransferase involved in cell wall biosynthesis
VKNDLVSIITANYNCENFIDDTIKSVLKQTYKNWEMIIVDDLSTDNSIKIIENYIKEDNRIKLIKLKENSGAAVARNRAIEEAKGRYIAFLDSDDLWEKTKLEKQLAFMQENSYDFTYTNYNLVDESNSRYGNTFKAKKESSYHDLLKTCSIGCLTVIYDTENLGKVTMPLILKRQDYGLWLKILKKIDKAYCLDESLAVYRTRQNSISSNKLKASQYQWKIYREVEKLNIFRSIYYFLYYAYNGLKKYK